MFGIHPYIREIFQTMNLAKILDVRRQPPGGHGQARRTATINVNGRCISIVISPWAAPSRAPVALAYAVLTTKLIET